MKHEVTTSRRIKTRSYPLIVKISMVYIVSPLFFQCKTYTNRINFRQMIFEPYGEIFNRPPINKYIVLPLCVDRSWPRPQSLVSRTYFQRAGMHGGLHPRILFGYRTSITMIKNRISRKETPAWMHLEF